MTLSAHPVRARATSAGRQAVTCMQDALRALVGGDRMANLIRAISTELQDVAVTLGRKPRLLDYGCGAMSIARELIAQDIIESATCVDIYPADENALPSAIQYTQLAADGSLPFAENSFDIALASDMLHHAGIVHAAARLQVLARCAPFILVKDHFEYGFVSRQLLRLADWYGNWGYGVNIPTHYFTIAQWEETVARAGLKELRRVAPLRIHEGLFGWILPPRHHFISLLSR